MRFADLIEGKHYFAKAKIGHSIIMVDVVYGGRDGRKARVYEEFITRVGTRIEPARRYHSVAPSTLLPIK